MDLHMPEMSGYAATVAVRKLKGDYYRDLPIIAVTATAFAEDRNKFASFGMNGYIIKPFTPPELYSKITHFIK
jgi:CheY-like chemotaxis protein